MHDRIKVASEQNNPLDYTALGIDVETEDIANNSDLKDKSTKQSRKKSLINSYVAKGKAAFVSFYIERGGAIMVFYI